MTQGSFAHLLELKLINTSDFTREKINWHRLQWGKQLIMNIKKAFIKLLNSLLERFVLTFNTNNHFWSRLGFYLQIEHHQKLKIISINIIVLPLPVQMISHVLQFWSRKVHYLNFLMRLKLICVKNSNSQQCWTMVLWNCWKMFSFQRMESE